MKVLLCPSVTVDGYIANSEGECYYWINPDDEQRYDNRVLASGT